MIAAAEINSDAQKGRKSDRKRRRKNDTIIEVGPGLGTLTKELVKTGVKIIAIEKDPLMIEILKETLTNSENIKIIQADARRLLIPRINNNREYKIVANLPYSAATFLIRQWLESKNPPKLMVLMIQKEVARRIVAKPPHMNLLAVSTQFYATAKIVDYVSKRQFWPKPKVDAAIIKIVPTRLPAPDSIADGGQEKNFFRIIKAGFSQPRKQLVNNFAKKLNISREKIISILKDLDISEKARAENLNLEQWQHLAYKLIHN